MENKSKIWKELSNFNCETSSNIFKAIAGVAIAAAAAAAAAIALLIGAL